MTKNLGTNSIITTTEDRDLIMERIFNAPRELVFKMFSDPVHLANWWGPEGWETNIRHFDFKPGGIWLYCMKCMDKNQGDFYGQESWGKAVYHEMIVHEKIVYTDSFVDAKGNVLDEMPEILVTMNFIEEEGKTKVITRSQFSSIEALQQVMDMGVVQGFVSQFNRLDALLQVVN